MPTTSIFITFAPAAAKYYLASLLLLELHLSKPQDKQKSFTPSESPGMTDLARNCGIKRINLQAPDYKT